MSSEHRRYSRIPTDILIKFFRKPVEKTVRYYQEGIVENCSTGGMFIRTDHPFSQGSIFNLEFQLESEIENQLFIRACAIVRWISQLMTQPGMGVEFVLFDGIGDREYHNWLTKMSS